ncbi:hypothetical protein O181_018057 [Austropuccinia psidii MF-1]|uniref:Uncharacterized protein n=1 Tax=Austropuccinia psidii MF-1 TaxID=1389203 RepID=A0A9Q3C734_9BASI|nr:hypothetical protein [Austropuccinia psidii MF-1]
MHSPLPPHPHIHKQPHPPQVVPHVSPTNGQCCLKLGPHMSWLCVHVSHPCTHAGTHCIVRRAPPMSSSHAALIHSYAKFGLGVHITHTPAPAVLCGRLHQCHPKNVNPAEVESFHG